jgi:hypothetical protein
MHRTGGWTRPGIFKYSPKNGFLRQKMANNIIPHNYTFCILIGLKLLDELFYIKGSYCQVI